MYFTTYQLLEYAEVEKILDGLAASTSGPCNFDLLYGVSSVFYYAGWKKQDISTFAILR